MTIAIYFQQLRNVRTQAVFFFIPLFSALTSSSALLQPRPMQADYVSYTTGAQGLMVSLDRFVIRMVEGLRDDSSNGLIAREIPLDLSRGHVELPRKHARIYFLEEGLATADVLAAIDRLNARPEVDFAAPVVQGAPGAHAATTDRFYMSFKAPVDEQELYAYLDVNGVEVVDKTEWSALGSFGYWLRATSTATTHALGMSNLLYEELQLSTRLRPMRAGPNFMPMYETLAAFPEDPPNDPLYNESGCEIGVNDCEGEGEGGCWSQEDCYLVEEEESGADCPYTYNHQCNLVSVNVPEAWETTTGSPHVVVAVIDSGVALNFGSGGHADLNPNQWFNDAEINGASSFDDDNNGYDDDKYGWNFDECTSCDDVACTDGGPIPSPGSSDGNASAHHGTVVAGIIAAATNNGEGIAGIAGGDYGASPPQPGCKIMPIRAWGFIDDPDEGDEDCRYGFQDSCRIAHAIKYATDNGAHVINMSLGFFEDDASCEDAVVNAYESGVAMVAAAHNHDGGFIDGNGESASFPARYPEVICVGALNLRRESSEQTVQRKFGDLTANGTPFNCLNIDCSFFVGGGPCFDFDREGQFGPCICQAGTEPAFGSNFGPSLDLMAPGFGVYTTTSEGEDEYRATPDFYFGKTSCATPHVAGVAALLLSASLSGEGENEPTLTPAQVHALMTFSADDLVYERGAEVATVGRDVYTGWGRVNAGAALELLRAPRWFIQGSGKHAASIDTFGNMIIDGIYLPVDESCVFDGFEGGGFFRVQAGDDIYAVITPDGHLGTHGQVYSQLDADLDTVPGQCVRFKNAEDETVAVITAENFNDSNVNPVSPYLVEAGSFLLKGKFFHGANPDRSEGYFIVCEE